MERDSLNSAIGWLGIVLGKTKDNGEHPYDYYLKASVLHEFGGSQDIHLRAANGETLDTHYDYGETWWKWDWEEPTGLIPIPWPIWMLRGHTAVN